MTDSLGVWLRRSRETRQLDLDDAACTPRIRRRYLQALEMGDYEALPGPIQARGFLRNYVRFLGCPSKTRRAMMRRRGKPRRLSTPSRGDSRRRAVPMSLH